MKKLFIALITIALLFIDWTALDAILRGGQNTLAKYMTLAGSVVIIFAMFSYTVRLRRKKEDTK